MGRSRVIPVCIYTPLPPPNRFSERRMASVDCVAQRIPTIRFTQPSRIFVLPSGEFLGWLAISPSRCGCYHYSHRVHLSDATYWVELSKWQEKINFIFLRSPIGVEFHKASSYKKPIKQRRKTCIGGHNNGEVRFLIMLEPRDDKHMGAEIVIPRMISKQFNSVSGL